MDRASHLDAVESRGAQQDPTDDMAEHGGQADGSAEPATGQRQHHNGDNVLGRAKQRHALAGATALTTSQGPGGELQ